MNEVFIKEGSYIRTEECFKDSFKAVIIDELTCAPIDQLKEVFIDGN